MEAVKKFVTEASFDANGVLIPAGHVGTFDAERLNGKEEHLLDADEMPPTAVVEIAPIAPTGPNPTTPQQLPANAVQGPGGEYVTPGKRLVSEVTRPAEERIDQRGLGSENNEAEVDEALKEIMGSAATAAAPATANAGQTSTENNDDDLVAGTVGEVTADLGTKTDEQLTQMRAAEVDREKPRKGVLDAIDEELEARKAS